MLTLTVRQALVQSGLVPIDAQVLLAHALQRDRTWIVGHGTDTLTREQAETFSALAKRRRDGEPVAYLTGVREFWGLALNVTRDVLIPRPETETLVEQALVRLPRENHVRVLDLGTGSGAIALALASERPQAHIVASDVSQAALAVAHSNAQRLGVTNVEFVESDWYAQLPVAPFAMIVSNPPYVAERDPHLTEGDLRFEPELALSSGDGLSSLRAIIGGAPARLTPGGVLLVEHGYDQRDAVRALLCDAGFADLVAARDLAGQWRVAGGTTRKE